MWVINREESPYLFKIHVQGKEFNEISQVMMRKSIYALFPYQDLYEIEDIRFFHDKNQYKIFVEI